MVTDRRFYLGIMLALFAIVAGLFVWSYVYRSQTHFPSGTNPILSEPKPAPPTPILPPVRTSDPVRGSTDRNAVTIVEFADYSDVTSRAIEQSIQNVLRDQQIPTRLIWRDLPTPSDQPIGMTAAIAARCAGDQGKFWEMHDAIFQSTRLDLDALKLIAKQLYLDGGRFETCIVSGPHLMEMQREMAVLAAAHIDTAPTIFVSSTAYTGYLSADQLILALWKAQRAGQ